MTTLTKTRTKVAKTREEIVISSTTHYPVKSVMRFGHYKDGSTAIQCYNPKSKKPTFRPTICLDVPALEGCVWLKGWAENDGVIDALIKADVVSLTGNVRASGKYYAFEARLLV